MRTMNIEKLLARQKRHEEARRALQRLASSALSGAKRSIFALQRGDDAKAEAELRDAGKALTKGAALVRRDIALMHDGAWRAAHEEYCEAAFLLGFVKHGDIRFSNLPTDDPEIIIGGLADFTGELARLAVLKATEGDRVAVENMHAVAEDVVAALLHLDLTGSLRTKFDQTKQHVRKLEDIRYDLARRV